MMSSVLTLNHLYSKSLNIYGDLGNIIALKYLCSKLDVELEVVNTEIGEKLSEADIYFIGGGQDRDQLVVYRDLLKHKEELGKEVERQKVFLMVCGGFQLFGDFFIDGAGNKIAGLGILPMVTEAPNDKVASRSIGNLIVKMSDEFVRYWGIDTSFSKYLVGFENHGGQTTLLSEKIRPTGEVVYGKGNNSTDKVEGAWYQSVIGCYLHGSLLPKNPHLGMAILNKALGKTIDLSTRLGMTSDFEVEKKAHEEVLKRLGIR